MKKLILAFALIVAASISTYGSTLTATTTCTPFSGPAVVVNGPGACAGGSFSLTALSSGFDASFNLFPGAYLAGGCEDPIFQTGCGLTEMAVTFSDELYFNQAGFATFYLDRSSNIPGSPEGQYPFGTVGGQAWANNVLTLAVGPGQGVNIAFSANWSGQCCAHGGPDNASVSLRISKIVFTDANGNPVASTYGTGSGLTYPVIDGVAIPEPASVLLSAMGLGLLAMLRRRLTSAH